jgi:hypothetical protein
VNAADLVVIEERERICLTIKRYIGELPPGFSLKPPTEKRTCTSGTDPMLSP